ncbi:hypothetical protein BJX96DRAFT_161042 [Aspergillus floccosus]
MGHTALIRVTDMADMPRFCLLLGEIWTTVTGHIPSRDPWSLFRDFASIDKV